MPVATPDLSTPGTVIDPWTDDPPAWTPFEIVDEGGLLRLRHYGSDAESSGLPPILLVYSLIKRPYILDLMPERSLVRNFLQQGFSVYLTDWLPPGFDDTRRGLDAYINGDLARAVECVRSRERVERISVVGCCFGGLLAVIYAALYPRSIQSLVPFALPFELRPPLGWETVDYVTRLYGNVPAWLIHAGLTAGTPSRANLPAYLAEDLGEPELARSAWEPQSPVERALQPWMNSDVPLAGGFFRDVMQDAYRHAELAQSQLRVGDRRVVLEQIRCPVLNIIGERDQLVPPESTVSLIERVGSRDASNLLFPTGHLGLMVSLAAQQTLWPRVGAWLRSRHAS